MYPALLAPMPAAVRIAAMLATACALATVKATTTAPSSSGSSPAPSAYIEAPQASITTVTPAYSGGYYGPSYGGHGFGYNYWGGYYYDSVVRTYVPRRYFFPPTPPALGDPYNRSRTKSASTVRSTIPLGLAEYVNEPFYSPLSPFLYEESLSKKRQRTLDEYKAAKSALVTELRARIASLEGADPTSREAQLATFAAQQSARIQEVEAMAERIRDDLTRWKLFSNTSNWNEGRDWRLGDDTRWESTLDDSKLMRGAAYFQAGLSPAQRRLLREYAMELDDSGRGPTAEIALAGPGPYFYFAPETSRVRLPAGIPADLQARITAYMQEKTQLKKELREVLYREDRRWFDSGRVRALRELADKQAPRLAVLETMAEEIRRGLAPLPNPVRPRSLTQSLPEPLPGRIASFMEKKEEFERVMNARLSALKHDFPTSRVEFVKMGSGFGIQIVGNRRLNDAEKARLEQARTELASFNAQQIDMYVGLVRDKQAIRDGIVNATGGLAPMVTPRLVDLILRDYTSTLAIHELWRRYREYETAVLQPGLSAEQRRILYDAALVDLDQQLPSYTY